jgi:signal transduction histidine kinase
MVESKLQLPAEVVENRISRPVLWPGTIRQQRLLVALFRWCLPIVLFAIVFSYETYEHIVTKGESWIDVYLGSEILFFGLAGPVAIFGVVSYVQRLLENQWAIQAELDELNRGLHQKVAERTAELEASNAELRQLDEMKNEFVSLVSHELRAPLTTLRGGLELALEKGDGLPGEAQHRLKIMYEESERLTAFVQRILDLSRLEAGRFPVIIGPVALHPMLRRSVEIVIGNTHPVKWELDAGLPLLMGDEEHLEEAVRMILSNIQKYTPVASPVLIQVARNAQCIQLTITDHGPGISQAIQERIFERFYRGVDKGDIQNTSGWGLGLYLARKLVEVQRGQLLVRSPVWTDEGAPGTSFIFSLPLDVER